MSDMRTLLDQSSHYLSSHVVAMLLQLVSFPILTRALPVEEYGLLGLLTITIMLMTAFCKSGMQNSIIRFYDEYVFARKEPGVFYSTFFFGTISIVISVVLLYGLVVGLVLPHFMSGQLLNFLFFITVLIFLKGTRFILTTFWRAERRTKLINVFSIFSQFLLVSISISFLFIFRKSISVLLAGYIVAECIIFSAVLYLILKERISYIRPAFFSVRLFKEALVFGFPLLGKELTNYILMYCDRYAIALLMPAVYLGYYSAMSNLSASIAAAVTSPLSFAIVPIYMQIWTRKGADATAEFLSDSLRYSMMIAIPIIMGTIAIGKDLILLLASSKYLEAYAILPFLITGSLIYGSMSMMEAGILIKKKSYIMMLSTMAAAGVNVILNITLIPLFGIAGAACATLFSYSLLQIMISIFSFRYLKFRIPVKKLCLYLVYAGVMCAGIVWIDLSSHLSNVVVKIAAGAAIYSLFVYVSEQELRKVVNKRLFVLIHLKQQRKI